MRRRAALLGALAMLVPSAAWAHGGDRAFVLLMPTGYYLAGGALAVAASIHVRIDLHRPHQLRNSCGGGA